MNKVVWLLVGVVLATLAPDAPARAQMPLLRYATVTESLIPASVQPGERASLAVAITVIPGFHINSAKPNDPDLIPTVVTPGVVSGLKFGAPIFPSAKIITAPSLSQKPLSVYTGHVVVRIPVTVTKGLKSGGYKIPVDVSYQGCNSVACYPPTSANVISTLNVR